MKTVSYYIRSSVTEPSIFRTVTYLNRTSIIRICFQSFDIIVERYFVASTSLYSAFIRHTNRVSVDFAQYLLVLDDE